MEEDAAAWADALDIDDSDLHLRSPSSSLPVRPCPTADPLPNKPPRYSPNQRIPGPASAAQDAMRLRPSAAADSPVLGRADAQPADADFLLHPWLCALEFLGKGLAWENPGIKDIKGDQELDRAPLVVGVVTSCKPNGLGDLFLTLKDPTDTISASIHKKVLVEGDIGKDISVGSAIVLNKVAVFRPSRTQCYLNVTKGKLVKVLRKDCDAPSKKVSSSATDSQLPETASILGVSHIERRAGTEICHGIPPIFSNMISENSGTGMANVHHSSILGVDRGKIQSTRKMTGISPQNKNAPMYKTSQHRLKTFDSINPANCQQRQGINLPMSEGSEPEGSTNNIMIRLLGQRMMPGCKDMAVAEVSSDHNGRIDSSTTSKHTSNSTTDGHPQQNFSVQNTYSEPSLGGRSLFAGNRHCNQANNELTQPLDNELMLYNSKRLENDTVLPEGYGVKSKLGAENNIDIEMLDVAEQFRGEHASIKKPDHHQKDSSTTNSPASNESLLSNPKNTMSVASVAEWTDEQLSELFAD